MLVAAAGRFQQGDHGCGVLIVGGGLSGRTVYGVNDKPHNGFGQLIYSIEIACYFPEIRSSTAVAIRSNRLSWPLRASSIRPTGRPPATGSGREMPQRSDRKSTRLNSSH